MHQIVLKIKKKQSLKFAIENNELIFKLVNKMNVASVPDTPTAATKTSRDLKEPAPVAAVNDSKPPQPQAQTTAENKSLIRENSHESDKEADSDRRAPIVSIKYFA